MRFREHRGGLAESMETAIEVATRDDLIAHLRAVLAPWPTAPDPAAIICEPYSGEDRRIGWAQTYIVTLPGYGVLGFADGPLPEPTRPWPLAYLYNGET
jgi:hypothetical protein